MELVLPLPPHLLAVLAVVLLIICAVARLGIGLDQQSDTLQRSLDDLDADRAEWARYPSPAPADTPEVPR